MIVFYSIVIAMIVLFLHACTWDGNIFEGIKKIIKPEGKLYKPIYGCPVCMAPWYGTLIYFIFFGSDWQEWILTILAAGGISVFSVIGIIIKDYCASRTIDVEKKSVDVPSDVPLKKESDSTPHTDYATSLLTKDNNRLVGHYTTTVPPYVTSLTVPMTKPHASVSPKKKSEMDIRDVAAKVGMTVTELLTAFEEAVKEGKLKPALKKTKTKQTKK